MDHVPLHLDAKNLHVAPGSYDVIGSDIFRDYFTVVAHTEPPLHFHRWSLLGCLAAALGRSCYVDQGVIGRIFPNLYITLIGEPAARKSTAIKICKRLLRRSGYETFAADKTSKEKFLVDLEGYIQPGQGYDITVKNPKYDAITSENLWGQSPDFAEPREVFIAADEFSEFMGSGNSEFYTTLGNLWDWDDETKPFVQSLKNSRGVSIFQPTINILSGTTPELFSRIFPADSIGSGFLSRLLLIHGARSGRSIAFPPRPSELLENSIVAFLTEHSHYGKGEVKKTEAAEAILTDIYTNVRPIEDARFTAYMQRRFTQLLKLCLILTMARRKVIITESIVIEANTILSHAEILMPKALGEFGKSKHGDVASIIISKLSEATSPVGAKDLWTFVRRDLDNQRQLMEILAGLTHAGKIHVVTTPGKVGYLPKIAVLGSIKHVDWGLLSKEECELAGLIGKGGW